MITNSVRHAFNGRGGTIQIELSGEGAYVQCCVTDDGSSAGTAAPGQGLRIIDSLARELDGQMAYRFGVDGAVSMLIFPLDSKVQCIDPDTAISNQDRDSFL